MTNKEKAREIASVLVDTDQTEAYNHLVALIEQSFEWKEKQIIDLLEKLHDEQQFLLYHQKPSSKLRAHFEGFTGILAKLIAMLSNEKAKEQTFGL